MCVNTRVNTHSLLSVEHWPPCKSPPHQVNTHNTHTTLFRETRPLCFTLSFHTMCACVPGPGVSSSARASIHPQLVSERDLAVLTSKAHLIVRSIQLKIGHDLLMQVGCVHLTYVCVMYV